MVRQIQSVLEGIYGVSLPVSAEDFIINEQTLAALIEKKLVDASFARRRGALLVYAEDDTINISLYFQQRLYTLLEEKDTKWINLDDLCTAFEEISHFFHLIYFWERQRQTTQLELELLGEIDKFLLSFLLLVPAINEERIRLLRYKLFGQFSPIEGLSSQQWQRYYHSYRLAARYCSHLERQFLKRSCLEALFQEVRHFHRLPCSEKMSLIARF
jgi:hypothetical protein